MTHSKKSRATAYKLGFVVSLGTAGLASGALTAAFDGLFGSQGPSSSAMATVDADEAAQPQPLQLMSTVMGEASLAVILDPLAGGSEVYAEGDRIRDAVVLEQIGPGYVVLRHGSQVERLDV